MIAFTLVKVWRSSKIIMAQLHANLDELARVTLAGNNKSKQDQQEVAEQNARSQQLGETLRRTRVSLVFCLNQLDDFKAKETQLREELGAMFMRAREAVKSLER
ncbi:unnamed protein product [Choristocarpus tenellus]